MKVEEYRELIDAVNIMVRDLDACIGDTEKAAWAKRAERLKLETYCSEGMCGRRTSRDAARMQGARDRLAIAFHGVEHLILS